MPDKQMSTSVANQWDPDKPPKYNPMMAKMHEFLNKHEPKKFDSNVGYWCICLSCGEIWIESGSKYASTERKAYMHQVFPKYGMHTMHMIPTYLQKAVMEYLRSTGWHRDDDGKINIDRLDFINTCSTGFGNRMRIK